jgi:LmbE family N-acetylglucosaminyl deacetylase
LEPHKIPDVYIYGSAVPDCWIDISETVDIKLQALLAHASQVDASSAEEIVKEWGRRDAERHPDKPEGFGEYAETFKYMHIG